MQLLMTMEQRQPLHRGRDVGFDLAEPLHQHDVFDNPGGRLAVYAGQLEAVSMQMNRMWIVGLIIENQAVSLPFYQLTRRGIGIVLLAVHSPMIELPRAAVDLSERELDCLVRERRRAVVAERRIVP